MKRIILALLVCFQFIHLSAQNFFKFQIGYASAVFEKSVNTTFPNFAGPNNSYGQGTRTEIGYIRTVSKTIDVELDVAYLSGNRINTPNSYFSYDVFTTGITQSWQISPMARFKLTDKTKLTPYFAIGLVMATGKIYYENMQTFDEFPRNSPPGTLKGTGYYLVKKEDTYSFSLGTKAVLGLGYNFGKFSAFFEVSLINLSVSPDRSTITANDEKRGGMVVSHLSDLPDDFINIVYKKDYGPLDIGGSVYDKYPSYGSGHERPKYYIPMSSLNVNVGLSYRFLSKRAKNI